MTPELREALEAALLNILQAENANRTTPIVGIGVDWYEGQQAQIVFRELPMTSGSGERFTVDNNPGQRR